MHHGSCKYSQSFWITQWCPSLTECLTKSSSTCAHCAHKVLPVLRTTHGICLWVLIAAKDLFCVGAHLHLCLEVILNYGLIPGLQISDVGSEENKKCYFLLPCPGFSCVRGTILSLWHLQFFPPPEQTRLLKPCREVIMKSCGSNLLCRETLAKTLPDSFHKEPVFGYTLYF